MMSLKNIFTAGTLVCISSLSCVAANNLPLDPNGEVVFKQTFKLSSTFTEDDAYDMVQGWFTQGTDKFTRQNEEVSVSSKNAAALANNNPLQSLDPYAKRMTGKGVTKYYGGINSCINLLCMEYYVILEVKDHDLTATITKIKYHHYNRRTNSEKPLYTWEGGKPFEPADKLEILLKDETRDINNLTSFLNEDMVKLFVDLNSYLKTKNILAESGRV